MRDGGAGGVPDCRGLAIGTNVFGAQNHNVHTDMVGSGGSPSDDLGEFRMHFTNIARDWF